MNQPPYKKLVIKLGDEDQTYIVEAHVTEIDVLTGNEAGVVCHMVDQGMTDLVLARLNGEPLEGVH